MPASRGFQSFGMQRVACTTKVAMQAIDASNHGRITTPPDADIINSRETYSSAFQNPEEVRLQITLFMRRFFYWLFPPCGNTSDT